MDQAYEISKEIEKLEIKKVDKLEELDENLSSLALRYRFFEKSYDIEKEIKLRNVTWKKIDELDWLKTELEELKI